MPGELTAPEVRRLPQTKTPLSKAQRRHGTIAALGSLAIMAFPL